MGQDFQLIAPRARLSLTWGAKVGEFLFDGSARDIFKLLTVPVQPLKSSHASKISQSTAKNNRQDSIAPQKRQNRHLKGEIVQGHGTEKRKADDDASIDAVQNQKKPKSGSRGLDYGGDVRQTIGLSDMPTEVHRLIFDEVEFIEDIICLSVTSQYFWSIGEEYIHEFYEGCLGKWAGYNIVCVGEDVEPDDYPPGLFSEEELDELRKKTIYMPFDDDFTDDISLSAQPFTLCHFCSPRVSYMEEFQSLDQTSSLIYSNCSHRAMWGDLNLKYPDIVVNESSYYPEDRPWILRNLTTKELVRSEAIALRPEYIHGPSIEVLGFGEVVLSRVCWSSHTSVSMEDPTNISRGVWAGHRFDIVTLAKHVAETKVEEWADISAEVADEIATIWESNGGPNWREDLCNRH